MHRSGSGIWEVRWALLRGSSKRDLPKAPANIMDQGYDFIEYEIRCTDIELV